MPLFIEGIEVTEEHIGSPVTYIPPHAIGDANHLDSQRVTSVHLTIHT